MKRLLVVSVLGLAGCVMSSTTHVYTDQSVVQTHFESNTKTVSEFHAREVRKHLPTETVKETPPPVETGCPVFELPKPGIRPTVPNFEGPTFITGADIDQALGEYIVALTAYIDNERARLERRHAEYRKQCRL